IGFRNRVYVLLEWFWAYLTRERSARLITGNAEELRDAVMFIEGEASVAVIDRLSKKQNSKTTSAS
ncbi:MAG: hypothetical protein M3Q26_05900, partial [Acidobacteriota bacterium]|nr:hypothetical protein [Acidobacteriota bacterium]